MRGAKVYQVLQQGREAHIHPRSHTDQGAPKDAHVTPDCTLLDRRRTDVLNGRPCGTERL